MPNHIDYSTDDLTTLLSDIKVQELLRLAKRYPNKPIHDLVAQLRLRGGRPRNWTDLTYKQARIILKRFNMVTPQQRKTWLTKKDEMGDVSKKCVPEFIDYNTVDLTTLLSEKQVHRLLDIAEQHPDWTILQMVRELTTRDTNRQVHQLLEIKKRHPHWTYSQITAQVELASKEHNVISYEQAETILHRLNMSTPEERKLRLAKIDEWEQSSKNSQEMLSKTLPTFCSYLKHRKQYHKQLMQNTQPIVADLQPPQFTAITPDEEPQTTQSPEITDKQVPVQTPLPQHTPVSAPVVTPQPSQPPRAAVPQYSFTPAQQATFKTFDRFFFLTRQFSFVIVGALLFLLSGSLVLDYLFKVQGYLQKIGMFFSFTAFTFGIFFLLYSLKYYLTIAILLSFSRNPQPEPQVKGIIPFIGRLFGVTIEIAEEKAKQAPAAPSRSPASLSLDLSTVTLERTPFVSIHVATYNEKRVVDRFLLAATSIEYDNYEIIVADDSNDETVQLIEQWKTNPRVKISHRATREGFKGGALKQALALTDPRAEYILVYDADFIPYPDTITQFLKYFKAATGSLTGTTSPIAAVQGYQWHVLNKSENWITRGVRTEYAGSYIIERSGTELYQGLKQISGSVYMIRADILRSIGWGTSLTEDFELTLKLYEQGYKVLYTPYIQAPAEAASTIKRLIRQRMRWAEGHSFNVKKMFHKLMFSPNLTRAEKFEFLYLSPYYLQAFFFILGTLSWFTAEIICRVTLPFWTEVWGWSLVLTNLFALPLMNMVGLFMEESEERDYTGLISFVLLSYIIAPFQAFASVKGFLETEEGPWFRTPKTGRITDNFTPSRFIRFVKGILGSPALNTIVNNRAFSISPYLALSPGNGAFLTRPRRPPWRAASILAIFLLATMLVNYFALFPAAPKAQAAWYNSNYTYKKQITINHTQVGLPTFDTKSSSQSFGSSALELNWTHTTANKSNRFLMVGIALDLGGGPPSSVTYGGQSLTKVDEVTCAAGKNCHTEMWYLKNPPVGANLVDIVITSMSNIVAGAATFYDVNQSTPLGTSVNATGNGTTSSLNITASSNQLIMDTYSDDNSPAGDSTPSQTSLWGRQDYMFGGGSYKTASSGANNISWTNPGNDYWADIAVPINPASLTDFPVLVSVTDDNLKSIGNGGYVSNTSGYDIIFTDSNETAKLDHEIESYNSANGSINMWVRIPTLNSSTNTSFYIYYDNSSVNSSQENITGVWDSNFKRVYHLVDGTTLSAKDSTANSQNGTINGATAITGKVDGAANFTYSGSQYISSPTTGLPTGANSWTMECWLKLPTVPAQGSGTWPPIIDLGTRVTGQEVSLWVDTDTQKLSLGLYNVYDIKAVTPSSGNFYHLVGTYDGANANFYVNGTSQGYHSATLNVTYGIANIGKGTWSDYLTGVTDEVRISSTDRYAGWISTEYNNQSSPSTFEKFGDAIEAPENLLFFIPLMFFLPKIMESIKKRQKLRLAMQQSLMENTTRQIHPRKQVQRVRKHTRYPSSKVTF